ncbi:hypothetical protein LH637_013045 [Bacillus infantis]|nr:hypothetical protein [Bacillus infantis]
MAERIKTPADIRRPGIINAGRLKTPITIKMIPAAFGFFFRVKMPARLRNSIRSQKTRNRISTASTKFIVPPAISRAAAVPSCPAISRRYLGSLLISSVKIFAVNPLDTRK